MDNKLIRGRTASCFQLTTRLRLGRFDFFLFHRFFSKCPTVHTFVRLLCQGAMDFKIQNEGAEKESLNKFRTWISTSLSTLLCNIFHMFRKCNLKTKYLVTLFFIRDELFRYYTDYFKSKFQVKTPTQVIKRTFKL